MTYCKGLVEAASNGDVPALEQALRDGTNINMQGYIALALQLAANHGYSNAVRTLLEAGAEVDGWHAWQYTALHSATHTYDNVPVIKVLLEAGADVDAQTQTLNTPLHQAAYLTDMNMVKILLAAGADPALTNEEGKTPADRARQFSSNPVADYLASVADGTAPRPTPEEVGLDMKKRIAALQKLGKPLGKFTEAEAKRIAQRKTREAQRQEALDSPSGGI